MLFVCYGFDDPEKLSTRLANREAHLGRLAVLDKEGRVFSAGPLLAKEGDNPATAGFAGSLLIVEFDLLAQAKAWWQADPYVMGGVFLSWGVHPFIRAFPKQILKD